MGHTGNDKLEMERNREMSLKLEKLEGFAGPKGPVVLVIMDGVGIGKYEEGDFVRSAAMPNLAWLKENGDRKSVV